MSQVKKLTLYANLLAIAIVLNVLESWINVIPVPGAKIGLANIVTLVVLVLYSPKDSILLVVMRVIIVSLLTGKLLNPIFYMSLSGGIFASLAMAFIYKLNFFGILGVSIIGSLFHTLGQIVAGIFVIGSVAVIGYLPIMLAISVPAGIATGIITVKFLDVLKNFTQVRA
jgi:heptaprenyl diphosphate synthase